MAFTALIGDFPTGTQYLWPRPAVTVRAFFDRPAWERPTRDNPFSAEDIYVPLVLTGSPGFEGDGASTDYVGGQGFQGGAPVGSFWEPPALGGDPLGGGVFTEVLPDGSVTTFEITDSRRAFYTIEVYDTDNDLVSRVPAWTRGSLKLQVDKASELSFTVALDAEGASDLVRPNTIWVRDRWGFVVDTFTIQRRKPYARGDAAYLDIFATAAISQLGEEAVIEYSSDGTTVAEHVAALMDLQEKTNAITLGDIDDDIGDIELPFFAADTNIHAALLSLQMALPIDQRGHIYVDPNRRLQWRLLIGDQTEQVITRTANVRGIDIETDYTQFYNRVYLYGEGQDPTTRLTLVDAGEANEYVEDTDSITAYDLKVLQKQDRRVRNPETLLRIANRILEEFSTPPLTVTVDLLDVAKSDDAIAGWADIFIGGKYRVVDAELGIDSSIEIVGIEIDMTNPVPLRVDLTNQTRDLSDLISRLITSLQQPLYVDGDRYPTMGRNYSDGVTTDNLRAGDTRWNADNDPPRGEMHDGTDWQGMGGGEEYHYVATTKSGLPSAGTVNVASIGRVDGVTSENGMFCVPNPDKDGWDALNFFE